MKRLRTEGFKNKINGTPKKPKKKRDEQSNLQRQEEDRAQWSKGVARDLQLQRRIGTHTETRRFRHVVFK